MSKPSPGLSDRKPQGDPSDADGALEDLDLDPLQQAVLAQDTRRAIVGLLATTPGLNKQQTADRIGIHRRTLDSHLRLLTWAELVITRRSDRGREKLCFLTRHEHLWEDEAIRILYGQAATRHVALVLHEAEPAKTQQIATVLDKSEETVRQHLAKLRERGLAIQVPSDGTVYHVATDDLRAWHEEWGDGYREPWTSEG